ncbi:MAG TPA: hypothetical protein VJN18_29685 [Polyangiaceae bacterium]|nr:hypothetical protein [Polyangiaceae bacterium]
MQKVQVDRVRFAIVDRPMCVMGIRLDEENLRFLRGLDPEFFLYQAAAHQHPDASGSEATRAALALRINYGMAVEALFGILGAVVQAPDCVFGWLSAYKNDELRELVRRISAAEAIKTLPPFRPATWLDISAALLEPLRAQSVERHQKVSELFARSWRLFAGELLNEQAGREYNSLKHGFRVQPGSVAIDISHEGNSLVRSESAFAHSFPYLKRSAARKNHYDVSHATRALEPAFFSAALSIIALSIGNAIAFARARPDAPGAKIAVHIPEHLELFDELWKERAPIAAMTYGGSVTVPENEYWSDAEILSVYED